MELISINTCPHCSFKKSEEMPTNACQRYYERTRYGTLLQPKPGDCCVFCSYGTNPCPPKQHDPNNNCRTS